MILENSVKNKEGISSQSRCSHCGGSHVTVKYFKQNRKDKGHKKSPFYWRNSNNKSNKYNCRKPNTCFRCGPEDHFIANFLKLETSDKKVHWNMEIPKNSAYRSMKIDKTLENSKYKSESQMIYTSMEHLSPNAEIPRRYIVDSSQLTN